MRGPEWMPETSMMEIFVRRADFTGEIACLPCRRFVPGMLRPPDLLACRSLRGQPDRRASTLSLRRKVLG